MRCELTWSVCWNTQGVPFPNDHERRAHKAWWVYTSTRNSISKRSWEARSQCPFVAITEEIVTASTQEVFGARGRSWRLRIVATLKLFSRDLLRIDITPVMRMANLTVDLRRWRPSTVGWFSVCDDLVLIRDRLWGSTLFFSDLDDGRTVLLGGHFLNVGEQL